MIVEWVVIAILSNFGFGIWVNSCLIGLVAKVRPEGLTKRVDVEPPSLKSTRFEKILGKGVNDTFSTEKRKEFLVEGLNG